MQIPSNSLREIRRLFNRLGHIRSQLPVHTHVLATRDDRGITLAVTEGRERIESLVAPATGEAPEAFLIPPDAMASACRADKGSEVSFTIRGGRRSPELRVTTICGGIPIESRHPTIHSDEFPARDDVKGSARTLPAATIEALSVVACCASTDTTREVLNGVYFNPGEGGCLVATDGRHLAFAPAVVTDRAFILPNRAVKILTHPAFAGHEASVALAIDTGEPANSRVEFRCGPHRLITVPVEGDYPAYRQVVPKDLNEMVTPAFERRPALVAWLRSLPASGTVRLGFAKRGQLTLTHQDESGGGAVLHVPAEIHGSPPAIAFSAKYFADAMEIGGTLCLRDAMTPGICRHPGGRFCLLMPLRVSVAAEAA